MFYNAIIQTPLGKLGILTANQLLTKIDFLTPESALIKPKDEFLSNIVDQLNHYFKYPGFQFTIPYQLQGTSFQICVWEALSKITLQKNISYGMLAKKLKTGARAIGNACRMNPLPILIPCHRVVAQKTLGGYKGKQITLKKWLLNHENYSGIY